MYYVFMCRHLDDREMALNSLIASGAFLTSSMIIVSSPLLASIIDSSVSFFEGCIKKAVGPKLTGSVEGAPQCGPAYGPSVERPAGVRLTWSTTTGKPRPVKSRRSKKIQESHSNVEQAAPEPMESTNCLPVARQ